MSKITSRPTPQPVTRTESEQDWSWLMARAQDGDKAAYGTLLRSITPYLRALASRAGLPPEEIEDAVQDVLLTIHTVRHTYDPARPLAPWLVAVARHRLIDRLRHRIRVQSQETALTAEHETFAVDETNSHEQQSESRRLRAAIAQLPIGQRQAIELLKLSELSLKEASGISGQSETSLKVAVHRALKKLQTLLVSR